MSDTTTEEARKKVWDMIKDIHIALFVTHGENEYLYARPMASLQTEFSNTLWFMTASDSPKIEEIKRNSHVLLSYSEPSKEQYVSVQGTARVFYDKAKIKELWVEMARTWFPKGPDDPRIMLIEVKVETAEYWDSKANSLVLLYGYAKARITGETAKVGDNKKVKFN